MFTLKDGDIVYPYKVDIDDVNDTINENSYTSNSGIFIVFRPNVYNSD